MFNLKIVLLLLLITTYQVKAVGLTGNTSGGFLVDGGGEVPSFQWGEARSFGGGRSSLAIVGKNGFAMNNNQPFEIAELTYNNTDIKTATSFSSSFSSVNLDMILNYADSSSFGIYNFSADIEIIETSNGNIDSDDTVSVLLDSDVSPVFSINGTDYIFEFLGFSNGNGGFDHSFIQAEGSSSSTSLYAKVTAVPVPAALWLFMTALTGFFMTSDRKRR